MRGLAKSFLYLIYAVIVLGLIAAIALTFHHDRVKAPAAPNISHQTAAKPKLAHVAKPKVATKKASPTTVRPSSQSASQQSSPSTAPTSSSSADLTNTGPGDTVGLFAAVSLTGFYLQRRRLLRRL
jgi:cytoskeletal protein RodZ